MPFLAMVHRFNPEKTNVNYDSFDPNKAKENLLAAFDFAEAEMGIPKLLDAQEVAEGTVDERSMVLYTSLFFHAFNTAKDREAWELEQKKKLEQIEAERIRKERLAEDNSKLLDRVEQLEKLIENVLHDKSLLLDEKQNLINEKLELNIHRSEIEEKFKLTQENVDTLKELIQTEKDEKIIIEKTKEQLNLEITELRGRIDLELGKKSKQESKMTEKLSEQTNRTRKLQKLQISLESERDDLKNLIEDLKGKIDSERKVQKDRQSEIDETLEIGKAQVGQLAALKRNLEQHIDDLVTWGKYLEYDKKSANDFENYLNYYTREELNHFETKEQLDLLAGKLDEETELMFKLLKQKHADVESERLEKEMKKSRAK